MIAVVGDAAGRSSASASAPTPSSCAGGARASGDEGELTAPARRVGRPGVDLLYDPVGGAQAEDAFGALARGGRLLAIGFASGSWPSIHTHRLVVTNTSLIGVLAGGASRGELDAIHAKLSEFLASATAAAAPSPSVSRSTSCRALATLADRDVLGKLVLDGLAGRA